MPVHMQESSAEEPLTCGGGREVGDFSEVTCGLHKKNMQSSCFYAIM